jgi:hypothetical protein
MKPEDQAEQTPGPDDLPDEFGPYLEDALRDREFARAYAEARREPTAIEARLARSAWARFGWRWLRTRGALAGRIGFDYAFSHRDGESALMSGEAEQRAARAIKGRIPW